MGNIEQINKDLIHFWNKNMNISIEDKKEYDNSLEKSIDDIIPSKKLYDEVITLSSCKKVLDYGCGTGWASLSLASHSNCFITSVDLGENIIDSLLFYKNAYGIKGNIHAFKIDASWLSNLEDNTYDGIICSNVLDVIPLETALDIIKNFSRILSKNGKLIIGLNYYLPKEKAKEFQMDFRLDRYLFQDGILRLSSLSDEEWKNIFLKYFKIEKLDHFSWPGEEKETRRLFVLRRIDDGK